MFISCANWKFHSNSRGSAYATVELPWIEVLDIFFDFGMIHRRRNTACTVSMLSQTCSRNIYSIVVFHRSFLFSVCKARAAPSISSSGNHVFFACYWRNETVSLAQLLCVVSLSRLYAEQSFFFFILCYKVQWTRSGARLAKVFSLSLSLQRSRSSNFVFFFIFHAELSLQLIFAPTWTLTDRSHCAAVLQHSLVWQILGGFSRSALAQIVIHCSNKSGSATTWLTWPTRRRWEDTTWIILEWRKQLRRFYTALLIQMVNRSVECARGPTWKFEQRLKEKNRM